MELGKNIVCESKILYDGIESGIKSGYVVAIQNREIRISIADLAKSSFKNLMQDLSENDKRKIIEEGLIFNDIPTYFKNYLPVDEYGKLLLTTRYYKSEAHLSLAYVVKDNLLILFTFGEKQPSRWILVIEGVWEVFEK